MLLECVDLNLQVENRVLVRGFSATVAPGQWISLLGPSGLGKTRLLRALHGDLPISSGEIRRHVPSRLLFQSHPIAGSFTALENVRLAELPLHPWWRTLTGLPPDPRKEMRQRAESLLNEMGLQEKAHRLAKSFSGGEKARTLIARFLHTRPKLLLADEPTASLDGESAITALRLMKREICDHGGSVICVLHSPELASKISDRIWQWDERELRPQEVSR